MPRKSRPSSEFNKIRTCNWCQKEFYSRQGIVRHLRKCKDSTSLGPTAVKNEAQKKLEIQHIDAPSTSEVTPKVNATKRKRKTCNACQQSLFNATKLKCHIRRHHFNLKAKQPYCDKKKVNQVWFEKVLNCNNIVEIRKTAPNTLVIRRLDENTAIKVAENNMDVIDLSHLYPTK